MEAVVRVDEDAAGAADQPVHFEDWPAGSSSRWIGAR